MKYYAEISTSHTPSALIILLSDPSFLLPRIFKSLKNLNVNGSSYSGDAKYMGIEHEFNGNVYSSLNEITYVFNLRHGKSGIGKIKIIVNPGKVSVSLEYEGWMERFASLVISSWIKDFLKNFEEDIRLERIKRKI